MKTLTPPAEQDLLTASPPVAGHEVFQDLKAAGQGLLVLAILQRRLATKFLLVPFAGLDRVLSWLLEAG